MKASSFSVQASSGASMANNGTTVRKPVSSLPSSYTPFYPRSQQQYCYSEIPRATVEEAKNSAGDAYDPESCNMYNSSIYACQEGSEGFELSWIEEDCYGPSNWNCPGTDWQFGGFPYVDSAAYQAVPSGSPSYSSFVSSQENAAFVAGTSAYQRNELPKGFAFGNFTRKPALLKVPPASSTEVPVDNGHPKEVAENVGKCSDANNHKYKDHVGENIYRKDIGNISTNRFTSPSICSEAQIQMQRNDVNNCKYKSQVGENIDIKNTVNISMSAQDRLTSPPTSSRSLPVVISQGPPVNEKNVKCEISFPLNSCDAGNQKTPSPESKICQPSVANALKITTGGSIDATSVHEQNSVLDKFQALDGHQLVMQSICHLSKVILRSKPRHANRSSDHGDLAIEKSLYMLSLSLLEKLHLNDNADVIPEINQESSGHYLSTSMSKVDEDAQTVLNFLHQGSISFPCQTRKNQGAQANESISSACGKQDLECENASIKKQISELKCNLSELKDEIAYERSENNVTVSMYKKLWNDARTELELSRLEILKINAEIEGIKKQFQKLKDTDSSCINWQTSFCKKPEDSECDKITGEDFINGNKVQAELVKSINVIQSDTASTGCTDIPSNQDSENCKVPCINASLLQRKDTVEHLETDVARRLSMLLARPKLGVNMNCNEEDAPFSHCDDSSDSSRNMIKEDWSKLKDSKNPYWSETSYDKMSHIGTTYAMNCESHDNWDSGEDDVEIICLRPNELDKQAIRGEAEWEHVEAAGKLTENYNYSEGFAYISTEIK